MKWVVRIVVGVLAVLAVSVLGLWIASHRRDAGRMRGNIEIARPVDQVWAWMTQGDKLTQWVGWLSAVEPDSTSPPEGIGHREIWVMDDPRMKEKLHVPGTITLWEPPNQMGVHIEVPNMFEGDVLYRLSELPNGHTKVEQDGRFKYLDRFAALMEPVVTPEAMRKMVADMQRLKTKVEEEPFPADSLGLEEPAPDTAADTTASN
ncbi:MAG: SRPBCC family protein [Candidatus Eisenbacteria bacterium]